MNIFRIIITLIVLVQFYCTAQQQYLVIEQYNQNQCGGDIITTIFYQTGVCYNGLYVTCSNKSQTATISTYLYVDCSSTPDNVANFNVGSCNGYDSYSCQAEVNFNQNAIIHTEYFNSSCDGTPYFAQTLSTGVCSSGVITLCDDKTIVTTTYDYLECTGQSSSQYSTLDTQCEFNNRFGAKAVCAVENSY
ncbi:hypothetical protein PPL_07178 [Heterostelium album PN500]|uniref:Transmembrane protein n=1 Tax=Heterostelium pallidum (strain ATCC 26659 / Pp 5 / PN500) TaxID=670386 RepID=D3BEL4_HETP5|nr:hypothetical protein PPL_07178 [Heterostelium album PN500]EFA80345.1 hypothetical protein PPL_07178 [Heterostelium album PN500]|eukprot:XP_020432465.1 hypothetical protein PPL_07178 [Heterostelium album PN500]